RPRAPRPRKPKDRRRPSWPPEKSVGQLVRYIILPDSFIRNKSFFEGESMVQNRRMSERMRAFCDRLGIAHPIIQAPLGGGGSTPELVAAASEAGGLGSLACAYLAPPEIAEAIAEVRGRTRKPFGVNLFAGGYERATETKSVPRSMLEIIVRHHKALG